MRFHYCLYVIFLILFTNLGLAQEVPKGSEIVELATQPDVSPDGKFFAFVWDGDIWTANTDGGKIRRITTHQAQETSPKISPNGKSIAFVSQRTGSWQVYTVSIYGGNLKQITNHSEGYFLMDWYPEGNHLLVRSKRDHRGPRVDRFFKISSKSIGGEKLLFDAHGDEARVSKNGKIIFQRGGVGLYRKGYKGSQSAQIWLWADNKFKRLVADEAGSRSPRWDANDGSYYYISGKSGAFNLYKRSINGGDEQKITQFEDDSVMLPSVSRDGNVIVFRHLAAFYKIDFSKDEVKPEKIVIWNRGERTGTKEDERLEIRTAGQAVFSNDGLEIAFVAGGDLWVMDTVLKEPKRITESAAEEREPVFSPDGNSIIYISDDGLSARLCRATRSDDNLYWWQNEDFKTETLSKEGEVVEDIIYSPDGKSISMIKGQGDLWIADADGKNQRKLISSWNAPRYDWSPNSRWIAYSVYDNNFNRDIWIVPVDGSKPAFNLSRHPDSDGGVKWSPDGKLLAFTGRRFDTETDIYYVWLKKSDEQISSRERELDKAVDLMKKSRPRKPSNSKPKIDKAPEKEEVEESRFIKGLRIMFNLPANQKKVEPKPEPPKEQKKVESKDSLIDFDGINERIRRISIPDVTESNLFWSPDSKKLAFSGKVKGVQGVYTIGFPVKSTTPTLLISKSIYMPRWLSKDSKIVYYSSGVPGAFVRGKSEVYPFKVLMKRSMSAHYRVGFLQAWRAMRDGFYDSALNNKDWNKIKDKYQEMAANAVDRYSFSRSISMMLGELNASHMGFRSSSSSLYKPKGWTDQTAHLGLIFDENYEGDGLKVKKVITKGPSDQEKSKIRQGEVISKINGVEVKRGDDIKEMLNGRIDRDIDLQVLATDEKKTERTVTVRPTTYSTARALLEDDVVRENKELVNKLSDGRLGYLHVERMMWSEFQKFEREIYAEGDGKEGLVIDVRNNGGGFTADHLLTVLVPPVHATTIPRGGGVGYPGDRRVYATWTKPIVVLCNEKSFSNAEIFSHAIKNLKRGKLVGVPTAGGVISTGSKSIMDLGTIRMPGRGWFLPNGEDMERNGAVPDHIVWPLPGELSSGKDRQLEKAIEVLLQDVNEQSKKVKVEMKPASKR